MNAVTVIEAAERPQLWLDVPKGQSFEDWCATGEKLQRTGHVLNWWIGDWWAAGNHRYGERAKAAAEGIFGKEFSTLANAASVCRAFETSRRREVLSWSHHAEVASLPPAEADLLLDRVEREAMPVNKLRTAARLRKLDLGILRPADANDDDTATKAAKKVQYIWNALTPADREYVFEAIRECADDGFRDMDT